MNLRLSLAAACLGGLILTGCPTTPPERQALSKEAVAKVQADIKREIGIYLAAVQDSTASRTAESREEFWCGSGDIKFDIASVKAVLTVTNETIKNTGVKAKIPFKTIE